MCSEWHGVQDTGVRARVVCGRAMHAHVVGLLACISQARLACVSAAGL